ncbi:MAG: class I SAM-dependent methyltransferase [Candidatus Omnitrophica bacterium]|nr:class I SAM-dependent methyltransferase [Candidatus Omnitrophota bacterium]
MQPSSIFDHQSYRFLYPFSTTRHQTVCQMLGSEKFQDVLELGCGKGDILTSKYKNFSRYTGLDLSPHQLSKIPEEIKKNSNVTLREYDLDQSLDFPNNSFDLVISISTLEYLFDPIAFIQGVHRVLKPGGTLLLHTVNIAFFPRRLQLLFGNLPTFNSLPGWEGGNLHDFTYASLKKLLIQNHFEILESRCSGLFPPLRMIWPNFLAGDMIFKCLKKKPLN